MSFFRHSWYSVISFRGCNNVSLFSAFILMRKSWWKIYNVKKYLLCGEEFKIHPCSIQNSNRRSILQMLCFDLLTRPKMPFKVVHRKEVTYPGRWKSEEVAQALRHVYITAWEFEGNIRPTNWGQLEIGEKEGKQYSGRRR